MAVSTLFQVRSNSLPCKPHPLISEFDDYMCRIRASQASFSSSSTSLTHQLSCLHDLNDCIDKLLLLPLTRQTLAGDRSRKWFDELLDGSLRLLDVCNAAKDALLQTKEYTLEIQSIIRRRRQGGSENILAIEVKKYITSRKMAKKAMNNLKFLDNNISISESGDEVAAFVTMLREVQLLTLAVLKSFASFVSGTTKLPSKPSNWLLASKLMFYKRVGSDKEEGNVNEFAMVDATLESVVGCKATCKYDNMENVQNYLKNLEMCIQDLEEGIHSLFRRMIKTRVSLLNIFN